MYWILIRRRESVRPDELCSYSDTTSESIPFPEIIMQRVKRLSPEEIAMRIIQCDQEVCDEHFLRELAHVLPSPEQVGILVSLLTSP